MTNEKKNEFVRRISQSNKSQLIVIDYEIFLVYMEDAKQALKEEKIQEFTRAIHKAQPVISHLIAILDFKYEISYQLMNLYRYVLSVLSKALARREEGLLEEAIHVIKPLHAAFEKISSEDTSQVLMQNTQKVYAGLTYGRSDLNETYSEPANSRGFLV